MDEYAWFEMIDKIIQESIRPVLKADGGDITLVDFSEGVVKIALEKTRVPVTFSNFLVTFKVSTGCSCGSCPIPAVAIRDGVLKRLKEEMPDIRSVEVVH
jgi:Fe-S cluster biogenesis protein NfuA